MRKNLVARRNKNRNFSQVEIMFKLRSLKLASSVLLASVTMLTLGASATLSQTESNEVKFFCSQMFDNAPNENIPATIAWIPERQGHIRLIAWKSDFFYKWNRQERCQAVSEKFQNASQQGRLNYLTYGEVDNYQVICAVANQGEKCKRENMLFTIKPQDYPDRVLTSLIGVVQGNSGEPIYQSTGQQVYVSVNELFRQSKIVSQASGSK
ncbi:COP23 domain-containing protein [Crinalium epipsammum]|nr:COP23 domain-containing protein [Crinalium epipsammum]